ncbi:MAG: hypothetical protein QOI55_417, partial [Actinomycetota bacterium]|nr:hypothetical protein [Actinomycetota bacterium]
QDLQQVDPRAALRRGVITGGDALAEREIGSLVRTVFAGYGNHYRANPDLDADRSIDGYVEWTVNHVGDGSKALWVLAEHAGGDPIGFAALALEKTAEIDLAGIVPDHRGRGWYRDLLDHTAALVLARGLREVWISTQASNAAAIRAWSSRGYRHEFTFNTVHIVKEWIVK